MASLLLVGIVIVLFLLIVRGGITDMQLILTITALAVLSRILYPLVKDSVRTKDSITE